MVKKLLFLLACACLLSTAKSNAQVPWPAAAGDSLFLDVNALDSMGRPVSVDSLWCYTWYYTTGTARVLGDSARFATAATIISGATDGDFRVSGRQGADSTITVASIGKTSKGRWTISAIVWAKAVKGSLSAAWQKEYAVGGLTTTNYFATSDPQAATIAAADFVAGAIDATAIATDAIGASQIGTAAIDADAIASDAIGAAEIAANAIGAAELADAAIDSATFANDVRQNFFDRVVHSGTAAGAGATTLTLAANSFAADEIVGDLMYVRSGTGAGQTRRITDFDAATEVATVDSAFTTTPTGAIYFIYPAGGSGFTPQNLARVIGDTTWKAPFADRNAGSTSFAAAATTNLNTVGWAQTGASSGADSGVVSRITRRMWGLDPADNGASNDSTTIDDRTVHLQRWDDADVATLLPGGTIANQTNITAGTIATVTNDVNVNSADSIGVISSDSIIALTANGRKIAGRSIGSLNQDSVIASAPAANVTLWGGVAVGSMPMAKTDSSVIRGNIVSQKINVNANGVVDTVRSSGLGTGNIKAGSFAADAITAGAIAVDAIGASEIGTDAIDVDAIAVGAVGASEIGTDAIDADAIAANAIGSAEIANAAIDTAALATDFKQFMGREISAGIAPSIASGNIETQDITGVDSIRGAWVYIASATTGSGQTRMIATYNTTTNVAQITPPWNPTPTGTVTYIIYSGYGGLDAALIYPDAIGASEFSDAAAGKPWQELTATYSTTVGSFGHAALNNDNTVGWAQTGAGGGSSCAGTGTYVSTVTVYDSNTTTGVSGTNVTIWNGATLTAGPLYTTSTGILTFQLDNGTYTIRAFNAGWRYTSNVDTIVVVSSGATSDIVYMKATTLGAASTPGLVRVQGDVRDLGLDSNIVGMEVIVEAVKNNLRCCETDTVNFFIAGKYSKAATWASSGRWYVDIPASASWNPDTDYRFRIRVPGASEFTKVVTVPNTNPWRLQWPW